MVVAQSPPQSPPPPTTTLRPTYREPTPPAKPDDSVPVWAFVWTLFGFKMAVVAVILFSHPGHATNLLVLATTWFWVIIPMIALASPVIFRWRLVKIRRRRAALRRSEWLLEADQASSGDD